MEEPTERNQNIYARGAVDDKGQLWMQMKAFESLFKSGDGKLPINVRVLFEGEEEVGGESIEEYVKKNANTGKLKADFALVTDTELFAPDLPTLCVGLRGLVYTELEAQGAKTDLHSGVYGGAAPNAIFGLIEIISKLKDADGKVLIPGFYDDVQKPTDDELKAWERLPFNEEEYRKAEVGSDVLTGEPGYSVLYRTWARPTLEVHGIVGGFQAPGAKTVIPARASAKVSMRLVPNQDADDIFKKYSDYVKKITPKGIKTNIKIHSKGPACVVNTDNPYARAAVEAMHEIFEKDTVYIRSGGSIPIVTQFDKDLKIPSIMMGMGLPDDNLHAPEREVPHPELLSRDRVDHSLLPETGRRIEFFHHGGHGEHGVIVGSNSSLCAQCLRGENFGCPVLAWFWLGRGSSLSAHHTFPLPGLMRCVAISVSA